MADKDPVLFFWFVLSMRMQVILGRPWGPFLERPGNSTGSKSYFEINVSRKVERVLTSNEVQFGYLANNFTVHFLNLLKLSSGMENKTA